MKRTLGMTVICALAVGLAAPMALAQGPTDQTYRQAPIPPTLLQDLEGPPPSDNSPDGPPVEASDNSPSEAASEEPREAAADTLPFTGLDVAIVALMGVALLGTGVAMRRSAGGPQT